MTLMCQSLGILSYVSGYKVDEFNDMGGYFIVRWQSHAHAWVEVLTEEGWSTFDPTHRQQLRQRANPRCNGSNT